MHWNGVATALSVDGAHWAEAGIAVQMDCANMTSDCAAWLGSGSVWRRPSATDDDEYVMNFSQDNYDCEPPHDGCQTIFFATSGDLLTWTPVAPDAERRGGLVFRYNTTLYDSPGRVRRATPAHHETVCPPDWSHLPVVVRCDCAPLWMLLPSPTQWDCISVLPRPGGGLYGYFTANPKRVPGGPADCGANATSACGAGFAESADGLHWRALPTPGPPSAGEVGGVAQIGGRTFLTFDGGHLFEAPSAAGPFVPVAANHEFLTGEGYAQFPRLWGGEATANESEVLVTHQQVIRGCYSCPMPAVYLGLVKRAVLGADGVLRAQWWAGNDALRSSPLTLRRVHEPRWPALMQTECVGRCMSSGLWLEGALPRPALGGRGFAGVWLQTDSVGFGLMVNFSRDGRLTFALGPQRSPGVWEGERQWSRMRRPLPGAIAGSRAGDGWATEPTAKRNPHVIDRAMRLDAWTPPRWRLLARNSWSGNGMVELYVNDVLALPYTLNGSLSGEFAMHGRAHVDRAHRLSLSEQGR